VTTIDWPASRPPRRGRFLLIALLAVVLFGGGTVLSYYVDALWFESLGLAEVFWTTINIQAAIFALFFTATFTILYGAYYALKPPRLGELSGGTVIINGQPVRLPVEPVLRMVAAGFALLVALATAFGMSAEWATFALYWYHDAAAMPSGAASDGADPIFGRPLTFYFFVLPVWRLLAGWATTLSVIVLGASIFFVVLSGGTRVLEGRRGAADLRTLRGVSAAFGLVLLTLALQVYLGRFSRIFAERNITFTGVTYTDAHVMLTGLMVVAAALIVGALIAFANAARRPSLRWLAAALAPAIACYVIVTIIGWYVAGFIVKPNELVREGPFITHNIEMTRQAYALNRVTQVPFPAEAGLAAIDPANNQDTLRNIRLWDWRALQDTLRQIQEIRTYYDFPDIDIDRYVVDGEERQMMLAVRELNVDRLPVSSRNWINEKLVYTHGYGITMNPVNGFTPEGMPALLLSNMPVESRVPELRVTRPEVYFGELTNTDVYVKTRQQEFNYPQGETNNVTSYEGSGGIQLGGFFRRLAIALDRGDLTKLPFSDDISAESRLLMRRNIRARVTALAPYLMLDSDPYIVLTEDGRLFWTMDAYTTSDMYPYARHYRVDDQRLNYLRNSVKVVVDAYNGAVDFYVFDPEPIVSAYRRVFPGMFKDASEMPAALRSHVRYPEMMLEVQATVYGLYHMTDPEVFYNREDLWTIASEVVTGAQRDQAAQTMEANYLLMRLPGERAQEFVEILPFTPANRNNMIGWIAGRSDGEHYGNTIVYHFPTTRLVDGPLQIEARIDQHPELSAQMSLWDQQGSSVRRGGLIVIPVGRALLYVEPIYLQAARSPMPELRIVVLAMQDRLAYGPTFEVALGRLLGEGAAPALRPGPGGTPPPTTAPRPGAAAPPATPPGVSELISEAARDLAEYQRLTAEGRLGEAGQRLEALKQKLDQLLKQQ
jgi:uncharacterized membrane protein (UPF0182 family)